MGGSSYAAFALPTASVGAKQLKTNSVTSPKVRPGRLTVSDFKASQRAGLTGPRGAEGPQGPQGQPGQPGAKGTTVAYAYVNADGSILGAESAGVAGSFSITNNGVYCLADAPAGAKSVMVSPSNRGENPDSVGAASVDMALESTPNYSGCPKGTDNVRVTLPDIQSGSMLTATPFRIWFED